MGNAVSPYEDTWESLALSVVGGIWVRGEG